MAENGCDRDSLSQIGHETRQAYRFQNSLLIFPLETDYLEVCDYHIVRILLLNRQRNFKMAHLDFVMSPIFVTAILKLPLIWTMRYGRYTVYHIAVLERNSRPKIAKLQFI